MSSFIFDKRREVVVKDQEHKNDRLEFVIEKLVKLELRLEEQSKTIRKQEREILELKFNEIENKIIFEKELKKLRDRVNKENSELFHLINVRSLEIRELKQKIKEMTATGYSQTTDNEKETVPVNSFLLGCKDKKVADHAIIQDPPTLSEIVALENMSAVILRSTKTDHSHVTYDDCDHDKTRSHAQFYEHLNGLFFNITETANRGYACLFKEIPNSRYFFMTRNSVKNVRGLIPRKYVMDMTNDNRKDGYKDEPEKEKDVLQGPRKLLDTYVRRFMRQEEEDSDLKIQHLDSKTINASPFQIDHVVMNPSRRHFGK
ncbi:hypothetical protein FSP39_024140 [Pinctada imbricata]|uniref:Uncharacterized protein n=1 Tax=Pinctada imbricata TaxID=66713 RepID=A0AA88Y1G9_PINIB|nr:hypothetical protein FSP39_024140 [Pinctada imbricata]